MACPAIEAHESDIVMDSQVQQIGVGEPTGRQDRLHADRGTGQQTHINAPEMMVLMGKQACHQ